MEMLKLSNWMLWKHCMLVVLHDLGLEQYIVKATSVPGVAKADEPTTAKLTRRWHEGDAKAWTRLELAISDVKMIHISGAMTASEMWKQLTSKSGKRS